MSMKEGGFGATDLDGALIGGVLEVKANLGYGVEGDGEATKNSGDEGDGTAEGLGDGEAIMEEDIVAIVTKDQAARSGGGWRMTGQL